MLMARLLMCSLRTHSVTALLQESGQNNALERKWMSHDAPKPSFEIIASSLEESCLEPTGSTSFRQIWDGHERKLTPEAGY